MSNSCSHFIVKKSQGMLEDSHDSVSIRFKTCDSLALHRMKSHLSSCKSFSMNSVRIMFHNMISNMYSVKF